MALTGYPVEDLALRRSFVDASRADARRAGRAAGRPRGSASSSWSSATSTGRRTPCPCSARPKGAPQNAAAVLHRGRVVARYAKHHLPNYGVFDEYRYFVPGQLADRRPGARRRRRDRHLRGHLAGGRPGRRSRARPAPGCCWSSTARRTSATRTTCGSTWCARRAAEAGCALAYVNMVGGQDELVFDGDSLVVDADGDAARPGAAVRRGAARRRPRPAGGRRDADAASPSTPATATTIERVRARRPTRCRPTSPAPAPVADRLDDEAEVYARARPRAARLRRARTASESVRARPVRRHRLGAGRGDRLRRARRGERPRRLACPSDYSSRALPDRRRRPGRAHRAATTRPCRSRRWSTRSWRRSTLTGLAEENLQARVRGVILMGLSNQHGHLVLAHAATRASSRSATPRSTATRSAASPRSRTCRRRWSGGWPGGATRTPSARGETPPIPEASITKPPSAELRPGQLDTDSLPAYDAARRHPRRLRRAGPRARASWWRPASTRRWSSRCCGWSTAPSTSGGSTRPARRSRFKAFGRDRRLPITNRWREHAAAALTRRVPGRAP